MANEDKSTIFAADAEEPPGLTGQGPSCPYNAADDADDTFYSRTRSKLARTHLKLSDLSIQDDLVYQSIIDTELGIDRHKQLLTYPPLLSGAPEKPPRHIASNGMQMDETKYNSQSICQSASFCRDTIALANSKSQCLERNEIPECFEDLDTHYNLFNEKSIQRQPQVMEHCNNSGRKWLKRPATDKEDALASLGQSKQSSSGTLKWTSPTQDGPSEGSIQASSELLQEHVVLLDLEATCTSDEESNISVITTDVWPHRPENLASQSSFVNDKGQEVAILNEGNEPADHPMCNIRMPYSPGDAIQRLSPIFGEPSGVENFNDSSPEQVVPSESHAVKPSKLDLKNMYDTGSSDNSSPQDFCTSNVCSYDRQLSLSSPSVPDISVCNTDATSSNLTEVSQAEAKVHANTSNKPHYEIYTLCSDMDIEYPSEPDEMSNSNNHINIDAVMSPNTIGCPAKEVQKLTLVSGHTAYRDELRPGETSCQLSEVRQKSPGSDLLNLCEGAVGGASPVYSTYSTTDSDSSSACGRIPLIELLPEELIFKILFYLSPSELCLNVAPISRKWRDFAHDPILWQFLDLSHFQNLSSLHLCRLLQRAKLLKSLNLRGWREVTEMKLVGCYCTMLREINLGFCENLSEETIQTLVYHCKGLTTVNVEGSETVDNTAALNFTCLPELRVLNMSHCTKITDEAIIHIAVLCEKLEALNIDGIPWISDNAIQCLASERNATLEAVFLDGAEMTDDSIEHLTGCSKLHTLSISFCEEFSDRSLTYLRKLNAPKHLRLKSGVEFTEPALADLFLADSLASLTYLNLTECSELCDRGVENLTRMCKRLQHLALCWCWDISDVGVESIVDNCGQLEVLDLLGLNKIRGKCLDRIPKALPYLKFLDLRQCNMIQDSMLVTLVTVKKDLSILNYYGEEVKSCTCNDDKTEESLSCQSASNPLIEH